MRPPLVQALVSTQNSDETNGSELKYSNYNFSNIIFKMWMKYPQILCLSHISSDRKSSKLNNLGQTHFSLLHGLLWKRLLMKSRKLCLQY